MSGSTVQDANRKIVARYWDEFWTKGNTEVVDELCSDDFSVFYPMHGRNVGKEAAKQSLIKFKRVSTAKPRTSSMLLTTHPFPFAKAFPDVSFKLLSPFPLIAENDYVVVRWFGGGRHTGEAFFDLPVGSLPQANSGKEMRFPGTTIFRLRDGKIIEEIGEESALVALQQLGLVKMNALPS